MEDIRSKYDFKDFPEGTRVVVITPIEDFSFFHHDPGVVTKNTYEYLGVSVKFDNPREFKDGYVQVGFNFHPYHLIPENCYEGWVDSIKAQGDGKKDQDKGDFDQLVKQLAKRNFHFSLSNALEGKRYVIAIFSPGGVMFDGDNIEEASTKALNWLNETQL